VSPSLCLPHRVFHCVSLAVSSIVVSLTVSSTVAQGEGDGEGEGGTTTLAELLRVVLDEVLLKRAMLPDASRPVANHG
jgi:hypothetical protein